MAHAMVTMARGLADDGPVRDDVGTGHVAGVLWLLSGFASFDELVTGRGRTPQDIAALCLDTLTRTVLRPA